jgi:hypothetical protein
MAVTIVTRWTGTADGATKAGRLAKALWMKHGAKDLRLSQIYTGPFSGQWIVATTFDDMAVYAKALAAVAGGAEYKKLVEIVAESGGSLQEREILVGVDL